MIQNEHYTQPPTNQTSKLTVVKLSGVRGEFLEVNGTTMISDRGMGYPTSIDIEIGSIVHVTMNAIEITNPLAIAGTSIGIPLMDGTPIDNTRAALPTVTYSFIMPKEGVDYDFSRV